MFLTLLIIRNVYWAENPHIRMISEGSCDTEDWSNDAENSALITGINYTWLYIHIENNDNNISLFLLYFWSNKCTWAHVRGFQKY